MLNPESRFGDRLGVSIGNASAARQRPAAIADRRLPVLFCLLLVGICLLAGLIWTRQPITYADPSLRASLETATAAAALVAALALWTCFREAQQLRDLLLLAAVATVGLVHVLAACAPAVLGAGVARSTAAAPVIGALLASGCFVAAAYASADEVADRRRRADLIAIAGAVAAVGLAELIGLLYGRLLTVHPVDGGLVALTRPDSFPLIVPDIILTAVAAAGFMSADRGGDRLASSCFAAGVSLSAIGLLGASVVAPAGSGLVSWPVLVNLLAVGLLMLGALRESSLRRRAAITARVTVERRRLARELHDGLCQDLAFIVASAERLLDLDGAQSPVMVAARRAFAASTGTLAELSASHADGLPEALRAVADELEIRYGITVSVRAHRVKLDPTDREDIVRIVREAIVNAARHGAAPHVFVELQPHDGAVVLRVRDDGQGLPSAHGRREGYGMRSMRERAAALGGQLNTRRHADGGTELELVLR